MLAARAWLLTILTISLCRPPLVTGKLTLLWVVRKLVHHGSYLTNQPCHFIRAKSSILDALAGANCR